MAVDSSGSLLSQEGQRGIEQYESAHMDNLKDGNIPEKWKYQKQYTNTWKSSRMKNDLRSSRKFTHQKKSHFQRREYIKHSLITQETSSFIYSTNLSSLCKYDNKYIRTRYSTACRHRSTSTNIQLLYLVFMYLFFSSFLLLNQAVTAAACSTCPTECSCTSGAQCFVDCSGRNLNYLPTNLDPSVEKLDLSNNLLETIPENYFNDFSSLEELSLHNNHLNSLTKYIFQQLPNLNNVTLSNNNWTCTCDVEWLQQLLKGEGDLTTRINVHDANQVECSSPSSYLNQPLKDVDLTTVKCASSYISCFHHSNGTSTVILWQYTDLESSITDDVECKKHCLLAGYSYAVINKFEPMCMCSTGTLPESVGSTCNGVCSETVFESGTICGRQVVLNTAMMASISFQIQGLRTYSRHEAVELSVIPDFTVENCPNFIWDFNDSTAVIVTEKYDVMHKYALAGSYYISVTVSCRGVYVSYSLVIYIEEPISDVNLHCNEVIQLDENINATVDIKHGSQPRLSWHSVSDSAVEYDETFLPLGSSFLEDMQTGYLVKSSPLGLLSAQTSCEENQGNLAVVDGSIISDYIYNNVITDALASGNSLFWIGVVIDDTLGGTVFYITQRSIDGSMYTNWAINQPNLEDSSARCIAYNATDSGKWYTLPCSEPLPYICQYRSPDTAVESLHFITGTAGFGSSTTSELENLLEVVPFPSPTSEKVYTLLFPGMWISHEGILSSWEFTGPTASYESVRLQLFRPSCSSGLQLIRPGCTTLSNSYATCGTVTEFNNCLQKITPCESGEQFCPITNSCKKLSEPCSYFAENVTSSIPTTGIPSYKLITEYVVNVPLVQNKIYQMIVQNGEELKINDMIGISFSNAETDVNNIQLNDLPLICQSTTLSSWRQNALLLQSNAWILPNTNLDISTNRWMESIWCDIRMYYSQQSSGSVPTSAFLTPTKAGNYTFIVSAFNNVSISSPAATCHVEVQDPVRSVSLVSPPSVGTSPEGYPIIAVAEGSVAKIVLKIEGGGSDVQAQFEGVDGSSGLVSECPIEIRSTLLECNSKSGEELRITETNISITEDSSLIKGRVSNSYSSSEINIRVTTEVEITGLRILPAAITRVLSSIPQVFKAEVDTGTNVVYSWVVDNLSKFTYTNQQYNVLFRTPAEYKLTVTATNAVSSMNESATLIVDEMNKLSSLEFVAVPDPFIAETNANIEFKAKFLVDMNINYQIEWTINDVVDTGTVIDQPHTGDPDPDSDVERVYANDAKNASFPTTGEKSIKIKVFNDYDSISETITVDVRSLLTGVVIEMTSNVPAVGDDLRFKVTGSPSTYGAVFTYVWGDGSSDPEHAQGTITHKYDSPGTYTVNMTADNKLNAMSNTTTITVYERITGLTLVSDGPTEITLPTTITADIATGKASALFTFDFATGSLIENVTTMAHSITYSSSGKYNVSVTAINHISSEQKYSEVHVFAIEVTNVNTTEECFKTNSNATMQAFMPTDVTTLFDYQWKFEDGSSKDIDSNNKLDHIFTSAGYHNVTARVTSKKTSKHDEMSVIVCVEDEITSVTITDSPATEIGSSTTFKLDSVGGTSPVYEIDFGDGTVKENISLADITHTYSATGNYTVLFTASNLVSEVTDTAYAVVQETVLGVNITTSSLYSPLIAKDLLVTYTATTTNGTGLVYEWDFEDGSSTKNGIETNHTYTTTGDFTITLTVSNLISSNTFDFVVSVKEPVTGASITGPGSIVRANTSVTFTASISTGGPGEKYYWKVTPGHDYTLYSSSFSYVFTEIKNYTISLKVENEVSADYAEIFALAADLILGVDISTDALVDDKYTARNEETRFEALLDSGENISSTTAGSTSVIKSDWTISINGVTEEVYNDSSIIFHKFKEVGLYTVSVNVSNGVSSQTSDIDVNSIDRIGDINFIVIDGFDGAAAMGSEVKIMAIVSVGSDLEFFWDPDDSGASYVQVNDTNLTYTYSTSGVYYPFVRVKNPLGNKTESYELTIQEAVTGLEITHVDALVPFYVPLSQPTNFRASIVTGNDVLYSWYYVGETGALSDIENSSNTQMNWKFPEVTTYKLIVNASNLVSWDQVNYTVTVVTPIINLDIVADSLLVATNSTVKIKGEVQYGDDVNFKFFINGTEISGTITSGNLSETSHFFSKPGTYEIFVEASNNVSTANSSKTISVRDPITGAKIGGCCSDEMYVATGENLTFSATVDTGTDIVYNWTITYENGQTVKGTGQEIHRSLSTVGEAKVDLIANNIVSESLATLTLRLQDKCVVQISIEDPGRTQYTNENITLNLNVLIGTNVTHYINWGDFPSNPETTKENKSTHIYRLRNDYTITVNSSNQVNWVENTVKVTISKLECVAPSISFVESSKSSKFFRSRTIYVESTITTNCSAYDVSYTWLVYKQDDCTTLDPNNVQKISVGSNKPMLVLPALTLEVSNYCFEVEVSYDNTYLSDKAAVSVGVLSTPLTVVIIGGTTRFLSKEAPLVLDAGFSFDPDVPSEQEKGLSFFWTCNSSNALTEEDYGYSDSNLPSKSAPCTIPIAFQTQYMFSIPAGTLEEEMQYDYMVTASKTGKTDSTAVQRVVVVPRTIPTTTIFCYTCYSMASYQISASFHVGLEGSCDTCSSTDNVQYIWEVLRVSEDGSEEDVIFPLDLTTTTTGAESKYLVVKEAALVNSYTYQFKLRINVDGEEGYSKLVLSPNLPPMNGTCEMTYNNWPKSPIYVLDTVVSFSCNNWQDDGLDEGSPLVYTIVASRNSSDGLEDIADTFILYRGTQYSYEGYIPLGHAEYDYLVNVKILVEDQLGTSTLALNENVTVILEEKDSYIDWLFNKTRDDLNRLVRLNDPQAILDYSAAAITVLNSVSNLSNSSVFDNEYSKRVLVRETVTDTVASIETTTLKEVQQVASVLEQCVIEPVEMQNPNIQRSVLSSVEHMVTRLGEFVNKEGQTTFQKATNDVLDIVGSLIRVVNYVIYDPTTAEMIAHPANGNVSVNYTEAYRREIVEKAMTNIDLLVENVLKSKVVDEEAVSFLSPVLSITSVKTTPNTAPKEQVNGGIYWNLPDHVFDGLGSDVEMFVVSMVYEQNPFTYGFPPHSLSSNGYANITSRVPRIEFTYPNGTAIPINNLATANEGNDKRVKLVMAQSAWEYMSFANTLDIVNASGSNYQPQAGLVFESTPELVEPLQSVAITIKNDNRDAETAVHIMIVYTKKYNNNKAEPNPLVEAYLGYSPKPNREDNVATLRISDTEMADGANHQLYTFYLNPSLNDTTTPEIYLNVSNYFTYEIIDLKIAVYYSLCLYYGESGDDLWATDGLYTSPESTYTVSVCYSDHLTSFGSFVINPPNLINVTDIVNIDFSQNPIALITVVVIMFLYIVAMIWARRLDLRDIKRASLIPLCGSNGSFKYEITIKTAAGIGSGTTANVGICVYGYDTRSGSRHLARKDAFQRGAVDTLQIASDVSLGEIYKIKLWHDNTGLDPGWCVDRVMVRDLQTEYKYYFMVNSWLQVYPDDEDETCLEKTVRVATEEELMNFSNIFGSQLSYGWEDAHLWLSVIERPTRSRFTRVQRVTCCVTLLLTFMLFSAFWYQGWDADGDVIPQDTIVGILRWKDIAVGAIVSLMVFPISLIIICVFKKSKSKVAPVKPWLERSRTAQTIEILDEIIDGNGRRYNADSDSDDDYDDESSGYHRGLPGQNEFLAEYLNETVDGGSLFHSRAQTPVSGKSKAYEASSSRRAKLHKGSGTVKSLDIKDKVWSDGSTIQLSDSPSSSGVTGSSGDIATSSEDRSSTSGSPDWPNRTTATKKGLLHLQNDTQLQKPVKFSTTSLTDSPQSTKKKPLRRRNTGFVRNTDSASPPNFVPDEDDDDDINDLWDVFGNDDNMEEDLVITNKQAVLKRTRGTKFSDIDELPLGDENRGLVLDDVMVSQSDEDSDESDVPLPDFSTSRGESRMSRASTYFGSSPQPSSEKYLLPHWCIYLNYFICFVTMAVCILFIILYGNAFGADTTKRWLLSMFVALLESFFIVEPIKVVLFAAFLALITKPINPEENDNLVDEPLVETYGHTDSFSKVRAPGGFALDKCKREAKKTKRSDKLLWNLAIYLIFLSSVAAVASWDRDTMGYYNTLAVKNSLFNSEFTLPTDAEGPRWQNKSSTFNEIRTVTDIWAWLDQVFADKIYGVKTSLENENLNNNLLGKVRLRQQRDIPSTCFVDTGRKQYNQITYLGQSCLNNDAWKQQTSNFAVGWNESSNGSWTWTGPEFGGVMYWGEDLMYDDSGYSQFINSTSSVAEAQTTLTELQSQNWIDRNTRVVFVEFTQLNPATYWFTVSVVMFEIGVSGGVRPSYDIQTVRIVVPSTSFYIDMLFMSFVGIIGIILLVRELRKARDPKLTAEIYFTKWTNWVNLIVLALTVTLCILFIYKEIYMEEVAQKYISDKTAFTNFYKIAFYTDLVTITACLLLFGVIARAARLLRFIKSWASIGDTIVASAGYLLGAAFMLLLFVLNFAILGYLVYGQSYTQVIPDFRDFPNAIYAMFRAFRGRLDVRICFDYSPFFTIFFFFLYFFGIFYIFCRIFAAILINEYKFSHGRKSHLRSDVPDYEILRHLIARIKMRLGIIKPKQYRPMVRFEGMSTPSSRGSFMSLDSFDTCFMPGRISQCSYATGISSSSSDSGFGTPSDHSISVYDYLTLDQPSDTPMDNQHLDYLYERLSNYSVDMMLHRFERVNVLTSEVTGMESQALEITQKKKQLAMLQSQAREIATAASSMTVQPHYIPSASENQRVEGSATTYSSRGHFSLHSQQAASQISLNSGRKSEISNDSRFQTVMQSMFPDGGDPLRHPPVRSSSYTGLVTQKAQGNKGGVHGTISASSVLGNTSSIGKSSMADKNSTKRRPHSDEGVRFSTDTTLLTQGKHSRASLNDLNSRSTKQSSGRSGSPHPQRNDLKTSKYRPSPLGKSPKKSAWW